MLKFVKVNVATGNHWVYHFIFLKKRGFDNRPKPPRNSNNFSRNLQRICWRNVLEWLGRDGSAADPARSCRGGRRNLFFRHLLCHWCMLLWLWRIMLLSDLSKLSTGNMTEDIISHLKGTSFE